MNDLTRLDQQLREKITGADEQRRLHRRNAEQRMELIERRYQEFTRVADRVTQDLIRPRMELLASFFDNAEPAAEGDRVHAHHCRYLFRHNERFPATATLDLGVCADVGVENLLVVYSLEILPMFFRFEGRDQIEFPLDGVDEPRLITWIEKKIHDFVDTYLHLGENDHYQRENLVVDPVCGMRVNKAWAAARMEYRGETYYFCVEECRAKFAANPQLYLKAFAEG
jgi:YHS domain-containing protein